jgi:integrase
MKLKLTHTAVEALPPGEHTYVARDAALPGFGCRVTPAGVKSWTYEYRPGGGRRSSTRRMTLGRIETMPCHKARTAAEKLHHQTRLGADPAGVRQEHRAAPTVAEIADRFLTEHAEPKLKASTAVKYRKYFASYVLPSLGAKRARDVTHRDIDRLHRSMGERGAETTANRVAALVSTMYGWAGKAGLVPRDLAPARDVTRFKERARERYLTSEEFARLGDALHEAETTGIPYAVDATKPKAKHAPRPEKRLTVFSPFAIAAIRLLLFTGCRAGEILGLEWSQVDTERGMIELPDAKSGRRFVLLNAPALSVLAGLPRVGRYVIAGDDPDKPRADLNRPWTAIRASAGLDGLRLHDLRHSHASVGAGLGLGLPVIGKLLGHLEVKTTARYAHLDNDPLRRPTDSIGAVIDAALNRKPGAAVVPLKPKSA